ncbi:MAG: Flp family type IVb pilin [Geminicoccaceae bacterium]
MTLDPRRSTLCHHSPSLLHDVRGATAIEYALLAALVAVVSIAGLQALGGGTGGLYGQLGAISAAIDGALGR